MNLNEIISTIATEWKPKKIERLLHSFAFSHRGEFENPNQPPSPSSTVFIPQTQVGYLTFDGNGGVSGEITVNRNGGASQLVAPNGTYKIIVKNGGIVTGTIETTSQFNAATKISLEYAFVVADNGKELKYAVQKATSTDQTGSTVKKALVWGTMRKIYS